MKLLFIWYFKEYKILGKKGEGTFSEVLKCQNVRDGTFWAAKKMKQLYKR
jgi:renal tumor antigen